MRESESRREGRCKPSETNASNFHVPRDPPDRRLRAAIVQEYPDERTKREAANGPHHPDDSEIRLGTRKCRSREVGYRRGKSI